MTGARNSGRSGETGTTAAPYADTGAPCGTRSESTFSGDRSKRGITDGRNEAGVGGGGMGTLNVGDG